MPNVKIYTTPVCTYCKMAKDYFQANNIEYKEVDVVADLTAQQEMFQKTGQMVVPVVDIDGQIFIGFDKKGMAQALNIIA